MPEHLLHPSAEELTAFSLGQLPPQHAARIERHIDQCGPCCETLLGLSTDDTFVALLRDTKESDAGVTVLEGVGPHPSDDRLESALRSLFAEHSRYEVVALIARGGMGDVFRAKHRMMERTVALKVIKQEFMCEPEAIERFRREVKAAARLSHPNIVTAYDADQAAGVHFLAMEYVDGVDLAQLVKDRGPLPVAEACEYIRQAANGLHYAHEREMVHRDIKPHNLMVTGQGTVKILDLGLAFLAAASSSSQDDSPRGPSHLTSAGTMIGTPDFVSPEQAHDAHTADIRSDIYSLGCTLYWLLTGESPFAGRSVQETVTAHDQREPKPLSDHRSDVPAGLEGVLRKMMARDPRQRFQTPRKVAEALGPFAIGETAPEEAPIQSATTIHSGGDPRSPRLLRAAGVLAIAAFVLVVGAIVFIQLGRTTLRFDVHDPQLAVMFGDERITLHDRGRTFEIEPGARQTFVVKQGGVEVASQSFSLKRGQDVVLRVTAVDGDVSIVPSEPSVTLQTRRSEMRASLERLRQQAEQGQQTWAERLSVPVRTRNSLDMPLVLIPPGQFAMGSTEEEIAAIRDFDPGVDKHTFRNRFLSSETPRHKVRISQPFYMGAHEVTVQQFRTFVEATGYRTEGERSGRGGSDGLGNRTPEWIWSQPGIPQADDHPVVQVSWNDAVAFCEWLSRKEGAPYTLPSEAQWEYACRSGSDGRWFCGDDAAVLREFAWFLGEGDRWPRKAVGSKKPNAFGLFDMHGNALEWCADWFSATYYRSSPAVDPSGPETAMMRVFRGGSAGYPRLSVRSASRYAMRPTWCSIGTGFRVIRQIETNR